MAKKNLITLYAAVMQEPRVTEEDAAMMVAICRADRNSGDPEIRYRHDYPIIATYDPKMIEQIADLHKYDIVFIKGVVVTQNVIKMAYCPNCGAEMSKPGTFVSITPIFLDKVYNPELMQKMYDVEHNMTGADAESKKQMDAEKKKLVYEEIHRCREISNSALIVGDVCNDPEKVLTTKTNTLCCQYQIAIPRTYRLSGVNIDTDEDTDYPWVKSYGANAKEDLKRIRKGTAVMVEGYIQARRTLRKAVCEQCGNEFTWRDSSMEFVPFQTEYLQRYITDDDLDAGGLV